MVRLHAVIDVPADRHRAAADFWAAATGWPVGAPWPGHPELRSLEPPAGPAYLHLQEIAGAPRVHVDVEADDPARFAARAVSLGATAVAEHDRWRTLLSPGGLPFCVPVGRSQGVPEPLALAGGHRARMVQVCVDAPGTAHEREVGFWRDLLGGRWVDSPAGEFAGKWHDDADSPLQLLFQRLDEPEGPVRAHLDHGTDDVPAEVRRLVGLGAEDLGPGRGWHVLRDPAGLVFCVTGNSPEPLRHRDLG